MYLNVHSQYSLRYGTLSVQTLVKHAKELGVEQMALTDINNSTGVIEFVRECGKAGIKPIAGIEFRKENKLLYIGIACNREGMKELNDFLTFYNLNKEELPDKPWNFQNACIIYPFTNTTAVELRENEYIGIRPEQLNKLFGKPLNQIKDKLVALHPVTVGNKIEYRLHEYLRAISLNTLLTKVAQVDKCSHEEIFASPETLKRLYSNCLFVIENTEKLLNNCAIEITPGSKNRKTFTGNTKDDKELLHKLAVEGMVYRYGKNNKEATRRIKEELKVINDLGFSAYFLITWDIIRYSMSRGYYHVGRGSGANSIVAYCYGSLM